MRKHFNRVLSLVLALALLLGLTPGVASAASEAASAGSVKVYTEEDNALLESDVFARISAAAVQEAETKGGIGAMTEADYIAMIPQVIEAITGSETYVPGSLQENGYFLVWQTTVGIPCCFDPRMEAELHCTVNDPTPAEMAAAEADAEAWAAELLETVSPDFYCPSSAEIGLIQPYWDSNSNYDDSSFCNYSPYYKSMWQSLYTLTGGSASYRYSMYNATVDNVANAVQNCAVVIMDSHGTTDYSGGYSDYTSQANSSYLCLITNAGITSADTQPHSGQYGTYYDCLSGYGYAYVNGQCIANHMSGTAPTSLVYMGICLGMATDKMFLGLRAKGVETVFGYSQSVTFSGEKIYMQAILGHIKDGDNFATALSKAKASYGNWDPAYSSYSLSQAKANRVAFPITVSSDDTYPGHGNVDDLQTVYSTWELLDTNTYEITAVSNNSAWGSVSVDGRVITASPNTGYYTAGCTVVSGSASVTQNGNVFTVQPHSDCTVRVDFAARPVYTVTYMANGATVGSDSAYGGDSVTLPAAAPAVEGWTFLGWTANQYEAATAKPAFSQPGAAYVLNGNKTLYALYTSVQPGVGDTVYKLLTEAPSDWSGNYVITYGRTAGTLYALKGLSGNKKYESASSGGAVAYASTGMHLEENALAGVDAAYVFQIAPYNGKYTVRNTSTGTYLASKSSYLYSYSSLSATYDSWTFTFSSGTVAARNGASSRYPYLAFNTGNKYFMINGTAGAEIYFWAEGKADLRVYSTSPVAGQTPDPGPAPHEHSYGAWTSNNNGTHSRACGCGDSQTENCQYQDVVTPPTTTSQGYTTHTCTVCGYSFVDSYVPAIGVDYTVSFSVPAGVAAISAVTVPAGTAVTLPTAGAPSGYTFLGWVTAAVNNAQTAPSQILTGSYTPTGDITLKALYSYTAAGSGSGYELVTEAPADWTGSYVITYGNTPGSMYVLKGLTGNKKYESASAGGSVAFSGTGITHSGNFLTDVSSAYVFNIAKYGGKYTIRNASTGTYLASKSSYLYSYGSFNTTYDCWSLALTGGAVAASNTASSRYPYLNFNTGSKYFMIKASACPALYFWRLTGEVSVTYYTTVIP